MDPGETSGTVPSGNGLPAVGDRDGEAAPDAEGYPKGVCGLFPYAGDGADSDLDGTIDDGCPASGVAAVGTPEQGLCGNGLDDDSADLNGSTVLGDAAGEIDGVADDGCVRTLTVQETCAEIWVDGAKTAAAGLPTGAGGDEDGADIQDVDITIGAQPGPGGGILPPDVVTSFGFSLHWAPDALDATARNAHFLIASVGTGSIFSDITNIPTTTSPAHEGVADAGPGEEGPGVLTRISLKGTTPGIATLTLSGVAIKDTAGIDFTIDVTNDGTFMAVSQDLDGDTVIEPVGDLGRETYTCADDADGDGVFDGTDNCPDDANPGQEDGDGDDLGDACDACPGDPGPASNGGCPLPTPTATPTATATATSTLTATATATATPTITPTPQPSPAPVGGTAELPAAPGDGAGDPAPAG